MIPVDDGNCLSFRPHAGRSFKSRQRLEAEILVLRHQLNVLQQRAPRRVHLHWASRALFIWLYRCCPRILDAITIVRPIPSCAGIEWVLPLTGDGNPAPLGADRGSARNCATSLKNERGEKGGRGGGEGRGGKEEE